MGALLGSCCSAGVCPLLPFQPHVCGLQHCTGAGCAQYHLFPLNTLKSGASCSLHAELWAPFLGPAALSPPQHGAPTAPKDAACSPLCSCHGNGGMQNLCLKPKTSKPSPPPDPEHPSQPAFSIFFLLGPDEDILGFIFHSGRW